MGTLILFISFVIVTVWQYEAAHYHEAELQHMKASLDVFVLLEDIRHPPYSPEISTCGFHTLKGNFFQNSVKVFFEQGLQ